MSKIIAIITILVSFLLVGTPIKYNCLALNIAIIVAGTIWVIYKIAIKKEKIQLQKIDFVIFLFYIAPIIPLLFNTYGSLEETIIALLRNISLFNFYIMLKKEDENCLLHAILAGGVILAILGIDERTAGFIYSHLELIGLPAVTNIENRMFSSLGYANSFAIIMAVEILIACYQMKLQKRMVYKVIYFILICLFEICLIWSYSRTVMAMTILLCFVYAVLIKRKKIYITIAVLGVLAVGAIYCVGLKFDKPLSLFQTQESTDSVRRDIYEIEPQKDYVFKFNINANSRLETIQNYAILIAEEDKYYDTITVHKVEFSNFQGEKEISFTSAKDTVKMVIYFNTNSSVGQKGLTINSLEINGEKFYLNYAYLPIKLVERVQSFSTKDKSVWERGVYFNDSLKIIKNNFLFGTGAKGWLYHYQEVQSYTYTSTEAHSFILQIFIENGIIGFATLIIMLVYAGIQTLKKRKNINEIDLAFLLLTLHSFVDFDMSFYCIMLLWITLFTFVIKKEQTTSEKPKIMIIQIAIIVLNIVAFILGGLAYQMKNENKTTIENISKNITEEKYDEAITEIKAYQKREKYYQFSMELEEIDYSKVSNENMEYIYQRLKNQQLIVNTEYNISRNELIKKILETTKNEEYLAKFSEIITSENEAMMNNILDQDKNRLPDIQMYQYLKQQREIYKYSISEREVGEQN